MKDSGQDHVRINLPVHRYSDVVRSFVPGRAVRKAPEIEPPHFLRGLYVLSIHDEEFVRVIRKMRDIVPHNEMSAEDTIDELASMSKGVFEEGRRRCCFRFCLRFRYGIYKVRLCVPDLDGRIAVI